VNNRLGRTRIGRILSGLTVIILPLLCTAAPATAQSTYAVYAVIDSLVYGTDADGDGYYETFSFRIGVDGDVTPGSASIHAKMISNTTGQSWWSVNPWTISGAATDYHYFSFNETDFAGYITGNTSLDFT